MLMDTKTGFVVLGFLYIILPLTVYLLLKDYKKASVKLWAFGGVLVGFGLGLVGIRPLYQALMPAWFTYTFVNGLTLFGYTMRIQSLRYDMGKPVSYLVWFLFVFAFVLEMELSQSSLGSIELRMESVLFWVATVVLILATTAYQYEKKFSISHVRWIYVTYYLLFLALLTRGVSLTLGLEAVDPMKNNLTNNLLVFFALISVIYSNVAYVAIMMARAEKESAQSTQKNTKLLTALNKQAKVIKDLMRVQAFSVVGTYGSTVVHEVLQPLTAMRFALENLKAHVFKLSEDKTTQARIEAVDSSAARAISVIENLRNFIVERDVQIGSVSVNHIIREVLDITASRAKSLNVQIDLKIDDEISVMADDHQLQRVLFNLVNNALDAIEKNSSNSKDKRILIDARYAQQKQFVIIKVVDTGIGLQAKDQVEIFEWLSSNSNKGMGIGLALSRMLVESWRGHISAYPADPKVDGLSGAVFELKLRGSQT